MLGIPATVSVLWFLGGRSLGTPPGASASVAAPSPPLHAPTLVETAAPAPIPAPAPPEPVVSPSSAALDPAAPVVRPQDQPIKPKAVPSAQAAILKPKPVSPSPKAPGSNELSDFGGRR
jgi:hypothetical protein